MWRRRSHQVENYIDIGIHPKMRNHDKDSPVVLKHDTNSIWISVIEARSEVNAYQEEWDDLTWDNLWSELIQDYFRWALTQPWKLLLITYLTHKTLDIDITSEEILGYIILLIELDEVSRNDWKQKIIEQWESMGYTVDDTELADILLKIHDSCEEVERINILSELYSLIRSSKPKSLSLDHISPDVERVLNKSNIADEVRDKILDLLNKYHVGDMRREEQKWWVITLSRIMLWDISISLRIGKDGKIVQTLSGGGSDTFFTTLENLERFIQNNSDPNIV